MSPENDEVNEVMEEALDEVKELDPESDFSWERMDETNLEDSYEERY